ncbi:MAG: beta-glucosidase [Ignisphaera sp.]
MDIEKVIENLSIEEKIRLLVGAGFSTKVPGAAGETRAIERLNIPSIVLSDGPAGVRIHPVRFKDATTYYATAFPNEVVLSSTWNTALVELVGRAIGEEAREYGVDVMLSPGLNMYRVPLCGRNFEYFSEDPLLAGELAAAYVRGVQSVGVGATLKHFVANEQETNRRMVDVVVSERALREIYLRAFEIAIERSRPWAVMGAYNKLYGKYCVQNEWLLTKILRGDLKFDGLIMTDWFAGDNPVEQIKAGTDLIMPGDDSTVQALLEAYRRGELDGGTIDARARKVLELISKTPKYKGYTPSNRPNLDEHAKIAYEAAVEGAVLLKNDNALPIAPDRRVAIFGRGSYLTIKGGLGSGDTHPRYAISIVDGLRERGVKLYEELDRIYRETILLKWIGVDVLSWFKHSRENAMKEGNIHGISWILTDFIESIMAHQAGVFIPENFLGDWIIEKAARESDVALITISRVSSEGFDRKPTKGDFYLRDDEYELIAKVSDIFHRHGKKVIVILNVPGPIEIVSWRDLVDAILVIWTPGQEAGRVAADIILGRATPSGKLPLTWPCDLYEIPAMRTFPGEPRDNPQRVVYEEGIYIGYRYYDTFAVEPAYEFGYGLSYTTFEYGDLSVAREGDSIVVKLKVRNSGRYPGKEAVQIYIKAPRGRIEKPFQELKGFRKTKLLNPGEEEEIAIKIPLKYLASFSGTKWIIEQGTYEIRVGASSRDIRLATTITIESDICFNTDWSTTHC